MIREVFCPAKVNLFLQIEGRRPDGYHELTSLVAPLDYGDWLEMRETEGTQDTLEIEGLPLEVQPDNLVLRAVQLYREQVPGLPVFAWKLKKKIPWGAGLGGGSSNAAGALQLLQQWNPVPLAQPELLKLALQLGADVPLFLRGEAGWMRGIGEQWQSLTDREIAAIQRWRLLLFHPGFPISTIWAYRQLAGHFTHLYAAEEGAAKLEKWHQQPDLPELLFNTLEHVAGSKYLAIPVLLGKLRANYQIPCLMSGSGSACVALFQQEQDIVPVIREIQDSWGVTPIVCDFAVGRS